MSIDDLDLDTRPYRILKYCLNADKASDLLKITFSTLRRQPNFGRKSYTHLKDTLQYHGFELPKDWKNW
jgi:DNA-directed RNA polymerase alpha subunit